VHGNLGILLAKIGRKREAKPEFETALRLFCEQGRDEDAKTVEKLIKKLDKKQDKKPNEI